MTKVVALTGGIASGKSAASRRFEELGVPVVDTDVIAHQLVEPGTKALESIVEHFGERVLLPSGHLDRAQLRNRIFSNPTQKSALESILHPAIRAEARRQLEEIDSAPYAIVVIPLLAESGRHRFDWVDRVLVIDTTTALQLDRLCSRDSVTTAQAQAALDAQATRQERLSVGDDVISNTSTLEVLAEKVDEQHAAYLSKFDSND